MERKLCVQATHQALPAMHGREYGRSHRVPSLELWPIQHLP